MTAGAEPTLLLVAGHAADDLDEVVLLLRRIRESFPLGAPASVDIRYRAETATVALLVTGLVDRDPLEAARAILDGWTGRLKVRALAPPPAAIDRLLAPFQRVVDEVLDSVAAVASLQTAAEGATHERRRGRRFPTTETRVEVASSVGTLTGRVVDLSVGGAFVETGAPHPPVGEVCPLELTDADDRARIEARVVFHLPEGRAAAFGRMAGFGVHFVSLSPAAREALSHVIARLAVGTDAPGAERRFERRLPVRLALDLRTEADVQKALTENLSSGGVFVKTAHPPERGSRVDLTLTLPGEDARLTVAAEVRHVVDAAGAEQHGQSPGVGLEFKDASAMVNERLSSFLAAVEARSRARILIADDAAFFRTILTDLLEGAGYEVLAAESGDAALHILTDELLTLDLLILDLEMPGLSGDQVIDRIRRLGGESDLPVLVLSGSVDAPEVRERLHGLGATDVISKSLPPKDLLAAVDRLLRR